MATDIGEQTYEQYLTTARWYRRRNRALFLAAYECQRCQSRQELQVHHLSYKRLGDELDTDLEVLCRGCHLGHHFNAMQKGLGVYVALVSEALKARRYTMLADVIEDVKRRCAKAGISYAHGQIHGAISLMGDKRIALQVPERYAELARTAGSGQPTGRAEAAGIIAQHGLQGWIKAMPQSHGKTTTADQVGEWRKEQSRPQYRCTPRGWELIKGKG